MPNEVLDKKAGASGLEFITCPYCSSDVQQAWAEELGFRAVRCADCEFIYCCPRPALAFIDSAVRTGSHAEEAGGLDVTSRRVGSKVEFYRRVFDEMFDDVWKREQPISWLDVGAGYGEVLEAVMALAPTGSHVEGLEPMAPKARKARERGLNITEDYLRPGREKVEYISAVDVFSHIPDFNSFLSDVRLVLKEHGELFLETGNLADVPNRADFPGELGLPDHLVFAGEKHLIGFLERAGFEVLRIRRRRIDGFMNLLKNFAKKVIGRPSQLGMPYASKYRQIQVRARLRSSAGRGS